MIEIPSDILLSLYNSKLRHDVAQYVPIDNKQISEQNLKHLHLKLKKHNITLYRKMAELWPYLKYGFIFKDSAVRTELASAFNNAFSAMCRPGFTIQLNNFNMNDTNNNNLRNKGLLLSSNIKTKIIDSPHGQLVIFEESEQ